MALTPQQRNELVTRVSMRLCALDDLLAPMRLHALGEVDGLKVTKALDDLYEAFRELAAEVDWPSLRKGLVRGPR